MELATQPGSILGRKVLALNQSGPQWQERPPRAVGVLPGRCSCARTKPSTMSVHRIELGLYDSDENGEALCIYSQHLKGCKVLMRKERDDAHYCTNLQIHTIQIDLHQAGEWWSRVGAGCA